jgi:hypothetical protein
LFSSSKGYAQFKGLDLLQKPQDKPLEYKLKLEEKLNLMFEQMNRDLIKLN